MENFTEAHHSENTSTSDLWDLALLGIIALLGLLIQSFIVAVNVNDWMKGRAITGADKIITSIGISRIFYHTAYLLFYASMFYLQQFHGMFSIFIICVHIVSVSSFSSISLSTLLFIFFYFKISTIHNIFFLRLKDFISRRIMCLIVASVLLSMVYSSMVILVNIKHVFTNSTEDFFSGSQQQINLGWNLVWTMFPLLMAFTASVLLLILLASHLCKMTKHGNATCSTDTYRRTMKFTIFSFLTGALDVILYLADLASEMVEISWFYDVITTMFPVLHSILLIYVATKLRNRFLRIVQCGTKVLCGRNAPEPRSRELVEVSRW